ncbi:MAG: hypothetical protein FWB96_10225 [Defluviitaleaceae bacterium]|nr:hypothetical protein [Defluviitaleaceae bacterium]MCL2263267.1 hypothetical protein [Defluviitaleaceae bacterium]
MIYACVKCEFLFERKNEPSKCPSCENQYVVGANAKQRQQFQELHGNMKELRAAELKARQQTN